VHRRIAEAFASLLAELQREAPLRAFVDFVKAFDRSQPGA